MSIILVADIFGKTSALIKLSEALTAKVIADPYDGVDMGFESEVEAYCYFMKHVGFEKYVSELLNLIKVTPSAHTLIGFSIGASVIWQLSAHLAAKHIRLGICYYGSQIRNLTAVDPLFEVELIFPKKERHFDVMELQTELSKKQNVKVSQVGHLHGFMNVYSSNYNQLAYAEQLNWLQSQLRRSALLR